MLRPEVIHQRGLDGKIVRAKSLVVGNDGAKPAFEGAPGGHPKTKTVLSRSFPVRGWPYDGAGPTVGDTLESEWGRVSDDKVTRHRQRIRVSDEIRDLCTVFAQTDDGWGQIRGMTYDRESS